MSEDKKVTKKADHAEIKQVGRFGLVGILNTAVDFAVYNGLLFLLPTVPAVWAGIISGTVAMINSFVFNKNFTFKTKKLPTDKLVMFFIITAAGLYIIRPIIIYGLTSYWLWPSQVLYNITSALNLPFSQEFDTRNLALVAAIAIVLVYNYLLYKYYIFNEKIK